MALEFVGINGASHRITIGGYDKSFELRRGQSTRVTFTADKTGTFPIVCTTHHPTMVAELNSRRQEIDQDPARRRWTA